MNVNSAMRQVATVVKAFQGQTKGKEFQVASVRAQEDGDVLEVTVKCVRRASMVSAVNAKILEWRHGSKPITTLVFSKSSFDRLSAELKEAASVTLSVSIVPRFTTYQGYRVLLDPGVSHDDYIEAL